MKLYLALSILIFASSAFSIESEKVYDIIVVAGQSNAEGVGLGATVDDTSNDDKIFQVGRVGEDNMKVIPAKDPLQSWSYPNNAVGFAMSFAREYAKTLAPNHRVLLVPVAYGGSSILVWEKSQNLYTDMKARVMAAIQSKPGSKVVAFLWHQGETDMIFINGKNPNMPNAKFYGAKLVEFLVNVRTDFPSSPIFPIIMGEPVPSWFKRKSARCKVMKEIKSIAKQGHELYFAGADGLKSNVEDGVSNDENQGIHFSAKAQTQYGKKYFKVFSERRSDNAEDFFCF